jgi:hypothetical protein
MFQTSFPHPSPIHSTLQQAQLNVVPTQTLTLTYVSQVFPTILPPPSRTQPSTPPTGGKPLFTPLFLGGDPNLFGQQPSMGGFPPQGSQLMGLGQQTSMSQPFTRGQPLYSGKISGQHPAGGKPSTSRSFSMGAYPPIGSQPLFEWGNEPFCINICIVCPN